MPLIFKEDKDKQKEKYSKYGTTITEYTDTGSDPSYSSGSDYEYADPEMEATYQAFVQANEEAKNAGYPTFWDTLSAQSQKDNVFNMLGNSFRNDGVEWFPGAKLAPFTPTSTQNTSLFDALGRSTTGQSKPDFVTDYSWDGDLTKDEKNAIVDLINGAETMEKLESAYKKAISYGNDELTKTAASDYYWKALDLTGSAQEYPSGYEDYVEALDPQLTPLFEDPSVVTRDVTLSQMTKGKYGSVGEFIDFYDGLTPEEKNGYWMTSLTGTSDLAIMGDGSNTPYDRVVADYDYWMNVNPFTVGPNESDFDAVYRYSGEQANVRGQNDDPVLTSPAAIPMYTEDPASTLEKFSTVDETYKSYVQTNTANGGLTGEQRDDIQGIIDELEAEFSDNKDASDLEKWMAANYISKYRDMLTAFNNDVWGNIGYLTGKYTAGFESAGTDMVGQFLMSLGDSKTLNSYFSENPYSYELVMSPNGIHYYDRVATDAGVPVSAVNAYVQANSTGYLNSWVENKTGANLSPDNKETLGWLAYTAGQFTPFMLTGLGKSFGSTGYEALGEGEASLLDEYPGLLDDFDYSVPGEVNAEDWFTIGSDDASFDWTLFPKDGSEAGAAFGGTGDVFKSTPEMENHIQYVDSSVPRSRGIGGAHNSEEFFKNDVQIVKAIPSQDIPGVTYCQYNMPLLGKDGLPAGGYGSTIFAKTVYDPEIFSKSEYIRRGIEAANNSYKVNGILGTTWEGIDSRGVKWIGYGKDGVPTSFFPDVPRP